MLRRYLKWFSLLCEGVRLVRRLVGHWTWRAQLTPMALSMFEEVYAFTEQGVSEVVPLPAVVLSELARCSTPRSVVPASFLPTITTHRWL